MSLAGLEPAVVFPARVLSPAHIPILLQRHILFDFPVIEAGVRIYRTNASEGSRTLTEPGLSRLPLPVGIREQKIVVKIREQKTVCREGLEPSVFLM